MVEIKGKHITSARQTSLMVSKASRAAAQETGSTPSQPVHNDFLRNSSINIEPWGSNNTRPLDLIDAAKSNDLLHSSIWFLTRAIYSGGLAYGVMQDGKFMPTNMPEIDKFVKDSKIGKYAINALYNLKHFWITFPEFILTKDRSKVAFVHSPDASWCRWNNHEMESEYWPEMCYINANWQQINDVNSEYTIPVKVINDFCGGIDWVRADNDYKYIMPDQQLPSIGTRYYPDPIWSTLLKTKWLDYANSIPEYKEAFLKNGAHLKYIIHVPYSWWEWKYPGFDQESDEKRKKIIDNEHKAFDDYLTGTGNAGKSILATFNDDPEMQRSGWAKWEIETIDSKVENLMNENSTFESSQHIYTALEMDGRLRGITPGGQQRGSGSDIKQAYNVMMALSKPEQDIVTHTLDWISEFNGWMMDGKQIVWQFKRIMISDLKDVSPSNRQSDADQGQ